MRERPILFSGPMVRAILDGRKTETRRLVTRHNSTFGSGTRCIWDHGDFDSAWVDGKGSGSEYLHVPMGAERCEWCAGLGDTVHRLWPRIAPASLWDQELDTETGYTPPAGRLWVREAHAYVPRTAYAMSEDGGKPLPHRVSPDGQDWCVYREGWTRCKPWKWRPSIHMHRWASRILLDVVEVRVERLKDIDTAAIRAEGAGDGIPGGEVAALRSHFGYLWDQINGKRAPWASNPWVWVIRFKRAEVSP